MENRKTYVVLNAISPAVRMITSIVLVALGYGIQLTSRNILLGLPLIIACLILNLVKSINVKRSVVKKYIWQEVTVSQLDQVLEQCKKIKKFNTSQTGCIIAAFIIFMVGIVFVVPLTYILTHLSFAFAATVINAIILFVGLAFSGRRHAWMPHNINIKAEIVKRLIEHREIKKDINAQAIPYLEVGEGKKGSVPNDCRFMVRFKDAPKEFLGVQGQISINNVKGRAYPYFYVVIIARPEFGLFKRFPKSPIDKCVIERKKTSEVDVMVIRQKTTKTSGYHTNEKTQEYILTHALNKARALLQAQEK
jgi:hypothetical protein